VISILILVWMSVISAIFWTAHPTSVRLAIGAGLQLVILTAICVEAGYVETGRGQKLRGILNCVAYIAFAVSLSTFIVDALR
jgi:hypothetical protein